MIETICGLPGGGKSYWAVEKIIDHIASGGVVVSNLRLRGVVESGRDGLQKYVLSPDAPIRERLLLYNKWTYQDGQYFFIDRDAFISGDWLKTLPCGVPSKHVLLVYDEINQLFDSLDKGKLLKEEHYRKLFEFLQLHRHYFIDVVLLLQDFSTLNARIRGLSENVHITSDIQGKRLFGIPVKNPLPLFLRFTYDKSGKFLLKGPVRVVKEKSVWELYDSYEKIGSFTLGEQIKVDFRPPQTEVTLGRKKKMNWYDRFFLLVVMLLVVWGFFRTSQSSGSAHVRVVTVTNTVSVASADQPLGNRKGGGVLGAFLHPVSTDGSENQPRPSMPRVTCEYQPYSVISCGFEHPTMFCILNGAKMLKGDRTQFGMLVDLEDRYLRFVDDDGREHFVYKVENGLVAVPVSDDGAVKARTVSVRQ